MSDSGERFLLRDPGGTEVPVGSVEALQERIESGDVSPDADLFDASTGQWAPAVDVPVFRFILEELELEGRLPDSMAPLLAALSEEEETPTEEEPSPSEDPFSLRMDLVEIPDIEPLLEPGLEEPAPWNSVPDPSDPSHSGKHDTDAPEATDAEDETEHAPGFTSMLESDLDSPPRAPEDDGPAGHGTSKTPEARREEDADAWFTPASEGGIVLPPVADQASRWEPEAEDEEIPLPQSSGPVQGVRPRVAALVLLLGIAGVVWIVLSTSSEAGWSEPEPTVASQVQAPSIPSIPGDLEAPGAVALAGIEAAFATVADSLRDERGLSSGPPGPWLSGFYLANAGEFPTVVAFWEGYLELLEDLRAADAEIYRAAVVTALDRVPITEDDRDRLIGYFGGRYEVQGAYRRQRYDSLVEAARAALRLHEVLVLHQGEIVYSPALGSGVSADPIIEAVVPEGPIQREVERALDQVFAALDRGRGGGAPSADGLRTDLFERFGDPF